MKSVVITISESYIDRLKSVAKMLRKEGLIITNLHEYGVITGNAEDNAINKMRQHKEIISLTEDKQAGIAPPESDIQ